MTSPFGALPRTPEPELMDEDTQARAYSEADFAAPHERFVDLFVEAAGVRIAGAALDLGCGPADVTVRLARRCLGLSLDGVDGSEAMLRYGRVRVAEAGLADRITLTRALLPRDPAPRAQYDVVVSNSLLHHLHDPQVLWTTVRRYARPGAFVFIMDLMRPRSQADVDRLVEEHTVGAPDVLRRDFAASLCAAFTVDEVTAQAAAAGLASLAVQAVSDRHLTASGVLPG